MTETQRLEVIADIIERVENRCMATDGPVSNTRQEMTDSELQEIYVLAAGKTYRERKSKTASPSRGR